jgi:hypothetical protein
MGDQDLFSPLVPSSVKLNFVFHGYQATTIWRFGILNTKHMNIALVLKWVWKLYHDGEGLWAYLLRAKYLGDQDLFSPLVPTLGSQF